MDRIIQDMIHTITNNYDGQMQSRHLSVAIQNNIPLTKYKCNYHFHKVLGVNKGSTHAEMNVVESLLKGYKGLKEFKARCVL